MPQSNREMDMHALVTLLGKGRVVEGGLSRYEEVSYRFPDGTIRDGAFFGLKLAEAIQPGLIVILGTPSSMWDVLVDAALAQDSAADPSSEDLRMGLMEAVDASTVSQDLLDRASNLVAHGLGIEVELRLVPAGVDEASQKQVLEIIAESVRGCESASIDVTHGYRHLGMLGFLSALALERMVQGVRVDSVWYGAFEMRQNGIAPAVRLDGLLRIQQWVDALNRFDASGNYGVFAPLLKQDGMAADKAECLSEAAFLELNFNLRDARKRLFTVREALGVDMPGASGLFQQQLLEHMDWIRLQTPQDMHFRLAERSMDRDDFIRAAVLALEGFHAGLAWNQKRDPWIYKERDEARTEFEESKPGGLGSLKALHGIRNALAHGTPPPDWANGLIDGKKVKLAKAIGNRDQLRGILKQAMTDLKQMLKQQG